CPRCLANSGKHSCKATLIPFAPARPAKRGPKLNQLAFACGRDRSRAIIHAELLIDVDQVRLYRCLGDKELLRQGPTRIAARQVLQDSNLAVRARSRWPAFTLSQ